MRVVITGGGTGGHIIPALAVASALKQQGHEVLYIGSLNSMESELAPGENISFAGIVFYGMPRGVNLKIFKWLLDLNTAIGDARQIIRDFNPDVVFGTGGYVSAPVILAARQCNKATIIHEPDAQPGLANCFLAGDAKHITAAFEESRLQFKLPPNSPRFTLTGNPIRPGFGTLNQAQAFKALGLGWDDTRTTLLVFGGSQGARQINTAITEALPTLINTLGLQVLHISGEKRHAETVQALPKGYTDHPHYKLLAYSKQMPELLAACDLAICRSGSLTLSELYASGTPAILVPYPHAAANHQYKNAMAAQQAGAALVLEDTQCTANTLVAEISALLANPAQVTQMQQNALKLARPNATEEIIACLKAVL